MAFDFAKGKDYELFFFSKNYYSNLWFDIAIKEFYWIFGSLAVTIAYLVFHMRSLFLGVSSMILILFSFPLAACVSTFIFRVTYFS